MILIFDGPEKAGKSTIISKLAECYSAKKVNIRKWGPVNPDDRVYKEPLLADCRSLNTISIWDRSWCSEHIYANLLNRDRRLKNDAFLGEWLYGRAVVTNGLRFMILTPPEILKKRRDNTDIEVNPVDEYDAFEEYADNWGWVKIYTNPGNVTLDMYNVTDAILSYELKIERAAADNYHDVTNLCGPPDAKILIVGDKKSERYIPGGFLPFSSLLTTKFGRILEQPIKYAYTNARECRPNIAAKYEVIVACGEIARRWVLYNVLPLNKHLVVYNIPHPAYSFRYNNEKGNAAKKYSYMVAAVLWQLQKKFESEENNVVAKIS